MPDEIEISFQDLVDGLGRNSTLVKRVLSAAGGEPPGALAAPCPRQDAAVKAALLALHTEIGLEIVRKKGDALIASKCPELQDALASCALGRICALGRTVDKARSEFMTGYLPRWEAIQEFKGVHDDFYWTAMDNLHDEFETFFQAIERSLAGFTTALGKDPR